MRYVVPYFRCGLRNQSGMTPSSATRFRTPLEPMIAVFTAPDRIKNPIKTTNAFEQSLAHCGPQHVHRQPADQVIAILVHADAVRDEQHGQEADPGGQHQAIDEDDERRLLEILHLRRLRLRDRPGPASPRRSSPGSSARRRSRCRISADDAQPVGLRSGLAARVCSILRLPEFGARQGIRAGDFSGHLPATGSVS